jgi:hypothetical protein
MPRRPDRGQHTILIVLRLFRGCSFRRDQGATTAASSLLARSAVVGVHSSPANPAERSTASRSMRRRAAPLDVPCRRAGTVAGSAIGRQALDAGTVASGARIKPGASPPYNGAVASIARIKPGEPGAAHSAASRSMPAPCRQALRSRAWLCCLRQLSEIRPIRVGNTASFRGE